MGRASVHPGGAGKEEEEHETKTFELARGLPSCSRQDLKVGAYPSLSSAARAGDSSGGRERGCVTPPTRHRVSSEGSYIFFFHVINFKLVHSYNVKQLTCIIFCSSGL